MAVITPYTIRTPFAYLWHTQVNCLSMATLWAEFGTKQTTL